MPSRANKATKSTRAPVGAALKAKLVSTKVSTKAKPVAKPKASTKSKPAGASKRKLHVDGGVEDKEPAAPAKKKMDEPAAPAESDTTPEAAKATMEPVAGTSDAKVYSTTLEVLRGI